jgi:hypothetical protein
LALCLYSGVETRGALVLDSLIGPATQNEVNAFKVFMRTQNPPRVPWDFRHNAWSFGPGGRNLEALGMMCEVSGDIGILNQMIRWTDECVPSATISCPPARAGSA